MEKLEISCPKCVSVNNHKAGFTDSGSQRYLCKDCGCKHTPSKKEYSEETKHLAIKAYYSGISGRGVGKLFGMSKANVFNWIKKTEGIVDK